MIDIKEINYRIGQRTLFEKASLSVAAGGKIGLIGLNGSGKTTLFNLILGKIQPESGEIAIPPGIKIAVSEQEITETDKTVLDFVLSRDEEVVALKTRLADETDPVKIADIYEHLNLLNEKAMPAKAASILAGLGFSFADQSRALKEFSGGLRMRAALAATLFRRADLLLLDEPTNHLDLETAIWFLNYIARLPQTMIIISHDKELLNKACDRIVEIDNRTLQTYGGNYDIFVRLKAERLAHTEAKAAKMTRERAHILSFVDRFRYKATKAKQVQSRIKMLARMGAAPEIPKDAAVSFKFPSPKALPPPLFTVSKGVAGYGGHIVLKNLNLRIDYDDRIAILGANGNGKSTLAKLIAGELALQGGELDASKQLKIGYFAQHQLESLNGGETAFDALSKIMAKAKATEIRAHLGRFGLIDKKADTEIVNLSGGEKARLQLALVTREAPHILIMDEPTNHLDILSREALAEALNEYEGAVVIITHDFSLIELTADRLWLVEKGGCREYDGDLNDYRLHVLNDCAEIRKPSAPKKEKTVVRPAGKSLAAVEKKLGVLAGRKAKAEEELAVGYNAEAQRKYDRITAEIAETEEEWLTLAEDHR